MYDIKIKVFNNESISNVYRFILVKDNNIIINKCDYYLNASLKGGIYYLFIMYKYKCYKYTLNVYKDYVYNIYLINNYLIKINITDAYYKDLPIEKGEIILESNYY